MSHERFSSLLSEKRHYLPPRHGKDVARVRSTKEYETLCKVARENNDEFWGDRARSLLHWYKPFDKVNNTDFTIPRVSWYEGGRLNAAYNCVDRHIITDRRNKAALIWQGEREMEVRCYTYQMLYTDVCRVASALTALHVRKGDRVALYLPMVPELVVAMLACARIGAIHTNIFTGYAEGGVLSRIRDSGAKIVVTADAVMRGGQPKPLKAKLDEVLSQCPSVERVVVVNRAHIPTTMLEGRDIWWGDLLNDFTLDADFPCVSMEANDPLFLLHTSGSSGRPTGVVHSTGGYLTYAAHTTQWVFDMKDTDVYWCTADCGWITGHTYLVYGPLSLGATTIMFEGTPTWPQPDRYWRIVEKFRVNILYTAPTVIRSLMRMGTEWTERYDLSSLRILGSVGEPLNPEAWVWYHTHIGKEQLPIVDTWWQTESGGVLLSPLPYATALTPGSVTKPLPGIEATVITDTNGVEEEAANEGGHLVVSAPWPGLMQGVFKNPEKFQSYFNRFPGKYLSGDGARVDENGNFWILGRMDDAINVSGHRLSTAEIESVLVAHPAVGEAGVVPMPHEVKGEAIYAYVALKNDFEWSEEIRKQLKQHVRNEIGALASPEYIQFVTELPKTLSGKTVRRILRKIASGSDKDDLGDMTTLASPSVLDEIIHNHQRVMAGSTEKTKGVCD